MSQTSPASSGSPRATSGRVSLNWAQGLALSVGVSLAVGFEVLRLRDLGWQPLAWLSDINIDSTPFLVLFALLPLCWRPFRLRLWQLSGAQLSGAQTSAASGSLTAISVAWLQCLAIGLISLWVSHAIDQLKVGESDRTFGSLPPAYHDEYSYLFQAHTFADGRLAYPSHPRLPGVFDQMHVVNEGQFASRYFPSTGLWMVPFLKWGHVVWGHWVAGSLSAMLLFWTGRCLGGPLVGLVAGLLCALSPGIGLFSNLLLAHHPTLLGLSLFLFAIVRMMQHPGLTWAFLAGVGLSFAMLARPMAAAGCGLPFGIWTLIWLLRGSARDDASQTKTTSAKLRWLVVLALGTPLILALGFQFALNQRITGDGWTTPYQLYTDTYTPRHVYGFNNVERGERNLGPKVIEDYDVWAENLTPPLAARNAGWRLLASWQWTLGLIPLAMGTVIFLLRTPRTDTAWWLVAAALLSLHLVHIPYWYVGIMNWHYVFETSLLWCLVFAGATQRVWVDWQRQGRALMQLWWCALVATALLPSFAAVPPFWNSSRLQVAVNMISYSRLKYARFQQALDTVRKQIQVSGTGALVLVDADRSDTHIDYVNNHPTLEAEILIGRHDVQQLDERQLRHAFPQRSIHVYQPSTGRMRPLDDKPNSD